MSIKNPETTCDLKSDVVDGIQKLHQANIDSAEGFREAANQIKHSDLAEKFRKWSQQRTQQAKELADIVSCNGAEVDSETSWLADLHRAYTDMKTAFTSNDVHAVLAEAERGEDHIKGAYEDVLKETPGTAANDVLQRQYADVKATHDEVRDLRDAHKDS